MRVEQYIMLLIEMRANMLLSPHCYAENDVIIKLRNRVEKQPIIIISGLLICMTHMANMFCSIEFCCLIN